MRNRLARMLALGIPLIMLVLAGVARDRTAAAQEVAASETTRLVRRALERLPYYGVFDYLVFQVDRGTVRLAGYDYQGTLKPHAEMAVKQAAGVVEVLNKIEVLPTSLNDDRIRWATFYRIYTDDFLSRYAPGGSMGAYREIQDERHFPGMQPFGTYPIHIIVKNGRIMLLGVVDSTIDRQIAEVRAREVEGVFDVDNGLLLTRGGSK